MTIQQILAELVEKVLEGHSQAVLTVGGGESPSATHQLWGARLRAEPGLSQEICLLNNTVEISTSRAECSDIVEPVVTSVKTSYSPALNQQGRLTV